MVEETETRWSNVCSLFCNLSFNQYVFAEKSSKIRDFIDFVDQTLVQHDGYNIHKFELCVNGEHVPPDRMSVWINFVVLHNVHQVSLCLGMVEKLPFSLYNSLTLRVLELTNMRFHLPISVKLPLLKTLRLSEVFFQIKDGPPNEFISGCSVLEELSILHCVWGHQNVLTISGSHLKTLCLVGFFPTFATRISSANLRKITYNGYVPYISPETLQSLYDVDFVFIDSADKVPERLSFFATGILLMLHNVVRLGLGGGYIEYLTMATEFFASRQIMSCVGLKHLSLGICATKREICAATFLLRKCPNLQSFVLRIQVITTPTSTVNMEKYLHEQDLPSEGLFKALRTVQISSFQGTENELEIVRFLLRHTNLLEKMQILWHQSPNDPKRLDEKIKAFSEAFPQLG